MKRNTSKELISLLRRMENLYEWTELVFGTDLHRVHAQVPSGTRLEIGRRMAGRSHISFKQSKILSLVS